MIGTKNLQVSTYDFNSLTFSWEYEHLPPGVDLTTSTIDIQRSESSDFSTYETIVQGLVANSYNSYTDALLSGVITQRYKDMNYRLRLVEDSGTETLSEKAWLTSTPSIKAKDILRRKNLILRLRGIPVYFLKKMNYGQPCSDCYDVVMDIQVDGNCSTCYNTRYVGGYYAPISLNAFITETPDINIVNRFGEFNPGQLIFSVAAYPELSVNDVIVDAKNKRWWINQIRNVSYRGYVVSQDATLSLVDRNDVLYDFDIT